MIAAATARTLSRSLEERAFRSNVNGRAFPSSDDGATVDRVREPDCPCGSGVQRASCDPGELVPCQGDECDRLFHRHSNAHRFCSSCSADRHRRFTSVSKRRRRKELRAAARVTREQQTIAAWEARQAARTLSTPTTEREEQLNLT